jgi:S-adenosylmethionine:tRNA ribosyltransferase-isomerase
MAAADHIQIDKYRYELPEKRIASYPLPDRDQSKLLTYKGGKIGHGEFNKLPLHLPKSSWLVFNNTRVIQARLQFRKHTGARIEVFCLEPVDPVDYQQAFESTSSCRWKCLVGNARKWKEGAILMETRISGKKLLLQARNAGQSGDSYLIDFQWEDARFSFGEIIENSGSTPIPPYLNRKAEESDKERYQTIYSSLNGSVAAPTAGLHFTEDMMKKLRKQGFRREELTLHVGAGTFIPVKSRDARDHSMHSEQVHVPRTFLEQWIQQPEHLIAVGTTSTRSLESLYWLGVKIINNQISDPAYMNIIQWDNEQLPDHLSLEESLDALLGFCTKHGLENLQFGTQLMIVPGYRFRTISGLITNFHLPGSTLLLLIAALIGEDWHRVYTYALANEFRFLSYGDSSLLLPKA